MPNTQLRQHIDDMPGILAKLERIPEITTRLTSSTPCAPTPSHWNRWMASKPWHYPITTATGS